MKPSFKKLVEAEKAATPGPWGKLTGDVWILDRTDDAEFIVQARNALPVLLEITKAAKEDRADCMDCHVDGTPCEHHKSIQSALDKLDWEGWDDG